MIELIIKHEGETKTGSIPSGWDELSVHQFLALESGANDLELLSILSGIDLNYIENTNTDLSKVLERVFEIFNSKPPDLTKQKKKPIFIDGKEIKFPKRMDLTRFGQKSMVKNLLVENVKVESIIAEVFAIYAQPLIDGKFDSSRIPELTTKIETLPIIEVFPYAVFFFKKLNGLKNHLRSN